MLTQNLRSQRKTSTMKPYIQTLCVQFVISPYVIGLNSETTCQITTENLFHCLKCGNITRTEVSFQAHLHTHYQDKFKCDTCSMIFDRKTTLTNHLQKHSGDIMKCKKCGKLYLYSQSYLEHIKYRHLPHKLIQCPSLQEVLLDHQHNMRSHKFKIHGSVKATLVYGQEREK